MKITKNFELDSPLACDTPKILCHFCQKPGANLKCKHSNCNKFAHLYCAWLDRISYLTKDEESCGGWRFTLRQESNYYGVSLQAFEKDVQKKIIKVFEKIFNVAKKWNKSQQFSSSVFDKLQKADKKVCVKDLKDTLIKLKIEMKNLVNLFPKVEDLAVLAGETIEGECQDHRVSEPLCICNSPYNSSQFMFACDSCENWFHCTCLQVSKKDINKGKQFHCQRCQDWASIRSQFFNKEDKQTCKTKDRNRIIPSSTKNFWILDYIIISIMLQEKINQILADTSNFEANYSNLLETAQFIPFKLSPLLTKLLENYSISSGINDVLFKYFPPQQDQYDSLVNQQNSRITNQKLTLELQCFEKIVQIYKQEELPNTTVISHLNFIIESKKWKLDFLQILETSGKDLTQADSNSYVIKNREGSKIQFFLALLHDNPPFTVALEGLDQLALELKQTILKKPTASNIQIFIAKGKKENFGVEKEVKALESDVVRTITILKQYMKPSPSLAQIEQILIEAETSLFQVQGPVVGVIERYKLLMTLLLRLSYYSSMFLQNNNDTWQNKRNLWIANQKQLDELFKDFERYGAHLGNESLVIKNNLMQLKIELEFNPVIENNQMVVPFDFLEFPPQEDENSRDFSKYIRAKSTEPTIVLDGLMLRWFEKLGKLYKAFTVGEEILLQQSFENKTVLTQTQVKQIMNKFSIQNVETQNQALLHFPDFKVLIQESVNLSHQDANIMEILRSHQKFYLSLQLDLLEKGKSSLAIQDLSFLENLINSMNLSESPKLLKICQNCRKFFLDYTNQVPSCELKIKNLFKKSNWDPQEDEMKNSLTNLLERSKTVPLLDILDKQQTLQKLLGQLKWKSDASNFVNSSTRPKKHPYKLLKALISEYKSLQIPTDCKLLKDLQTLYQQVRENRQMSKDQIMILDKIKKELSEISETRTAANIHKAKLTLSSALQVQKAYRNCPFAILSEKDMIESDMVINAYSKFREEVQGFVQQVDENLTLENFSLILSNLKNMKNQIMTLVLKDDETEEQISLYEKKLQAKILLNKKAFGSFTEINRSPEEWKKLSSALEKTGSQQALLNNMIVQLDVYQKLEKQILTIKERQGFLSMVQDASGMDLKEARKDLVTQLHLQDLTQRLTQCPVENKDLTEFLQQVNAEVDFVREACQSLDSNKELQKEEIRPIMADIPTLIEFLNKIPVNLDEEQTFLESYLQYLQALDQPEPEPVEEQQNIPNEIIVSDQIRDESLYTTPKKSLTIMGFLEDCQPKELIMQAHENHETESTASQSDLSPGEIQAWKLKVAELQTLEKEQQESKSIIKFLSIKELLLEGYELLFAHENFQGMIETIKYMEHLVKEIEKHVRKTCKLSRNRLASETVVIQPLWDGFVDLRDEFSAFHMVTSFGMDYKSIVRNFGTKNKREIISIIKKEKGFLNSGAPKIVIQPAATEELLSKRGPVDDDNDDENLENELKNKVFIDEQRTVIKPKSTHEDEEEQPVAAEEAIDVPQVKVVKERKKKEVRNQTKVEISKILNNNKDLNKKRGTKKMLVTGLESRLHEMADKSKEEYKKLREYLYSFLVLTHKNPDLISDQDSQITLNKIWALFDNYVRSNLQSSEDPEIDECAPGSPILDSAPTPKHDDVEEKTEEIPVQTEEINNNPIIEEVPEQEEQEEEETQSHSHPFLENNCDQPDDKAFFENHKIPVNHYANSNLQTQVIYSHFFKIQLTRFLGSHSIWMFALFVFEHSKSFCSNQEFSSCKFHQLSKLSSRS